MLSQCLFYVQRLRDEKKVQGNYCQRIKRDNYENHPWIYDCVLLSTYQLTRHKILGTTLINQFG